MNLRHIVATFAVLATPFSAFAEEKQQPTLRIYVIPRTGADGFVEGGRNLDTVKDLRENLSKRKGVIMAESPQDADLVVEVVYSAPVLAGTSTNTNLTRGIFGGIVANTTTTQKTLPSIGVQLHVRGSEATKDIVVTAQMFWKDLAKAAANQTINWVNANWAQLQKTLNK